MLLHSWAEPLPLLRPPYIASHHSLSVRLLWCSCRFSVVVSGGPCVSHPEPSRVHVIVRRRGWRADATTCVRVAKAGHVDIAITLTVALAHGQP